MVDKNYCMSSFLSFRYIKDENKDFYEGMFHRNYEPVANRYRVVCNSAAALGEEMERTMAIKATKRSAVLLSGGMDSAIVASFMPRGSIAYTFESKAEGALNEVERAAQFAAQYGLIHKVVPIEWSDFDFYAPRLMKMKGAPIHSIEVQIYKAALMAKAEGVDCMFVGESADLIYGGMDKLLSKDWKYDEYKTRYAFVNPSDVLHDSVDMDAEFAPYRKGVDDIDFEKFLEKVFSIESSGSYYNAFRCADLEYFDPFAWTVMSDPLDLARVRSGESKYIVRELFAKRYPTIPVPNKIPMPRAVAIWLKDWAGPKRPEFKTFDVSKLTGDQKWLVYVLEKFLDLNE